MSWLWILPLTEKYVKDKIFLALSFDNTMKLPSNSQQVRRYILQGAEREGIELSG